MLAQAQRSHVSPDLFDIGQALTLQAALASITASQWVLAIGRPDGSMLLMVDDDFIYGCVFFSFVGMLYTPSWVS